ncbi:MAG: hypothetical protein AB7R55_02285 [Gemmatimonadales bacterium]
MSRMVQILADPAELRIFEDPDLAGRWLARSSSVLTPHVDSARGWR